MTPTLPGRWQTRLLLFATAGLLVTVAFGLMLGDLQTPLLLLGYVLALGMVWEVLYQQVQALRWDHDWPPAFQLGAGILEAAAVWTLLEAVGLPGIASGAVPLGQFAAHYGAVWLATFLGTQGPLRILFPRWRFRGGQWL